MVALAGRGRRSLGRARSLIDDLFAFAQAGARPRRGASTVVAEVVDGVVEELRAPALERGVTINVNAAASARRGALRERRADQPAVEPAAQRDQAHGRQPAPAGRVRVSPRYDRVRFEVEDTGPGLPPELVPQAFDPYVRGRGTREPGLGLGLATVRRLVEGHDGRYGVASRPGEGSLFWFELPAADLPSPARSLTPPR